MPAKQPKWLLDVQESNYPTATSYLNLLFPTKGVEKIIDKLRAARLGKFKAKDRFRASQVSLPGVSNSHVEKDRQKIKERWCRLLNSNVEVPWKYHPLANIWLASRSTK